MASANSASRKRKSEKLASRRGAYRSHWWRFLALAVAGIVMFVSASISKALMPYSELLLDEHSIRNADGKQLQFRLYLEELLNSSSRSDRFPSASDRVKVYMPDWYVPPCPGRDPEIEFRFMKDPGDYIYDDDNDEPSNKQQFLELVIREPLQPPLNSSSYFNITISNKIESGHLFFFDTSSSSSSTNTMDDCAAWPSWWFVMSSYCKDIIRLGLTRLTQEDQCNLTNHRESNIPLIFMFGDILYPHKLGMPPVPVFRKYRLATTRANLERAVGVFATASTNKSKTSMSCYKAPLPNRPTLNGGYPEGITLPMNSKRHFGRVPRIPAVDIGWEHKKDMAIFRGVHTGRKNDQTRESNTTTAFSICRSNPRCRLVLDHVNSSIIDAGLTGVIKGMSRDRANELLQKSPTKFDVAYVGMQFVLQYKGIIMVEGNDVASGLKWALYSQSVVLMAPPTRTTWAMEELLQPFVHYIPLEPDLSNAEEMMQWVLDHEDQAQQIARRATLWMYDLMFHPHAEQENEQITREILRRYMAHFSSSHSSSSGGKIDSSNCEVIG